MWIDWNRHPKTWLNSTAGFKKESVRRFWFGSETINHPWDGRTTQARPEYITDYTLVDNQVKGRESSFPLTDIVFLPSLILQHAGVPLGPFYETTAMMRDLCQGRYQDCPDSRLLKAYQNEIYVNQAIAK